MKMLPKTLCLLAVSITLGTAAPAFADAAKPADPAKPAADPAKPAN